MRTERDIAYFSNVRYEEGLVSGLAKGREEERLDLVKRLKAVGVGIGQIAQATGLTQEQIAQM